MTRKSLLILFLSVVSLPELAFPGSIDWSGQYRIEGLTVFNPDLSSSQKSYMLQHLVLRPKVTAYDGLTLYSRLDIFNNPVYPNEALGSTLGGQQGGMGSESWSRPVWASASHTLRDQQTSGTVQVNELYAQWERPFYLIMAGRIPLHFGLGMSFNGGLGPFDHWLENRDMVAAQIFIGDFTLAPILAKSWEGSLGRQDDVYDYIGQIYYTKRQSRLKMGFIWQSRVSSGGERSNDTPTEGWIPEAQQTSAYSMNSYNIFVSQWVGSVKVNFELGFNEGSTGLEVGGRSVDQSGLGGVLQAEWSSSDSSWTFSSHLGYASGDDPSTPNKWEGYAFDPNYRVAFLLFNHPLGQADFLGTSYLRPHTEGSNNPVGNNFDSEVVSNTFFVNAGLGRTWGETFGIKTQWTYARLNQSLIQGGGLNGGLEVDIALSYEPFKGFLWVNELGAFFPGSGFKGGARNVDPQGAYGLETRAVVRF